MDDNDAKPMPEADIAPPAADAGLEPAVPVKDGAGGADAAGGSSDGDAPRPASGITQQASDRALSLVDQGKSRATDALDQLSRFLTDTAQQIDERLGGQYGDYAKTAAGNVQQFADDLRGRDAESLMEDARRFVRRSPGIAIGAAAAVGFVAARLVSAGIDQHNA